jgi:hypothetical protein
MPSLTLHRQLAEIPAAGWNSLHDSSNPFVTHAFLSGLEQFDCLRAAWGWQPLHAALWQGEQLLAAAPGYIKSNSHGEFVFDHAWAHAYAQHGLEYFPKWLIGVPYSPVTGPRLLSDSPQHRRELLDLMRAALPRLRVSSLHVNFLPEPELPDFDSSWLARCDVQFHWQRRPHWQHFDEFLADLSHKKRKNIRSERARVAADGYRFRVLHGDEASDGDLADMHALYCKTFAEHGNHPALSLGFLQHLARTMPRSLVLALAGRGAACEAGALFLRGGDTLYGRYWGALCDSPGLHFEACYYQGIEYCLREGLSRFEPGAQGEHKIARGFLPRFTHSRHCVAQPDFAAALQPWCLDERESVRGYFAAALRHSPYRDAPDPTLA